MRARIGMVFQRFNLFPHLTALDNVAVGPIKVSAPAGGGCAPRRAGTAGEGRSGAQAPTSIRRCCPAASSNASPSPVRWRCSRR